MIDFDKEQAVEMKDVHKLPRVRQLIGPRKKATTQYKWASDGRCGVKLEVKTIGARQYTTVEAVGRFLDVVEADILRSRAKSAAKTQPAKQDAGLASLLSALRDDVVFRRAAAALFMAHNVHADATVMENAIYAWKAADALLATESEVSDELLDRLTAPSSNGHARGEILGLPIESV